MFPALMLKTENEGLSIRYQLHTCHATNLGLLISSCRQCAAPKEGPDFCMRAAWKKRSVSFIVCATGCQGDSWDLQVVL